MTILTLFLFDFKVMPWLATCTSSTRKREGALDRGGAFDTQNIENHFGIYTKVFDHAV